MSVRASSGIVRAASRHRGFTLFFIIYAVVFLYTLPGYGLTWDTYAEYPRAAAYVEWHVSGRAGPAEVPADERLPWGTLTYDEAKASNTQSANGCLPSLCAALAGKLLYQKLHWLGPLDATHCGLAALWLAGLLLFYLRAAALVGRAAALLGTATLALAPRIFEDAHNNMKDLPSMLFGGIAILDWTRGVLRGQSGPILFGGLWFGISLASKHTSVILLFPMAVAAVATWIVQRRLPTRRECWAIPAALLISAIILFGHLPHLWVEPSEALRRVRDILSIGTRRKIENPHVTVAALWISIITTPEVVLAGASFGFAAAGSSLRHGSVARRIVFIVLAAWLLAVFGVWSSGRLQLFDGIRNFQHFWPALALLSALGWTWVAGILSLRFASLRRIAFAACACVAWIPIVLVDIHYHPHQIVYFNSLVGGLRGAQTHASRDVGAPVVFEPVDYWGSSLRMCVEWANEHLRDGDRLAFGLGRHIGSYYFLRSGIRKDCREGEGNACDATYVLSVERPLRFEPCDVRARADGTPVFEVSVDGVRLAAIFKLPAGFNCCHNAPRLEVAGRVTEADGSTSLQFRLHSEPCAAGKPIYLFIGGQGDFAGTPFAVGGMERTWVPWTEWIERLRAARGAAAPVDRVPAAVSGTDMVFTIPVGALSIPPSLAPVSRAFAAILGGTENGLLSNPVEVRVD